MKSSPILILLLLVIFHIHAQSPSCNEADTVIEKGDTLTTELFCYDDGTPRRLVNYLNGQLHGVVKSWYPDGSKGGESHYAHGRSHGLRIGLFETGDTSMMADYRNGKPVGLLRRYYSADHPKRFTNFNDSGDKHGWEIFWYDNGNVKDSILFRNDSTMRRRSYYYNGTPQMFEDDIYGTYDAVSFNPKGKRTGRIKDGTGAVFLCDSIGGDCKELKYKDGKRVIE